MEPHPRGGFRHGRLKHNIKRTNRLCTNLSLQLCHKAPKRRVKVKLREGRSPSPMLSQTSAIDFVHDQLAKGKKIRALTVVDIFSKYSPVIDPKFSYRAEDVVKTLERACGDARYPATTRVDQDSEFVSRNLDLWAYANGIILDFSGLAKPTENAFIEAVYIRVRSECLKAHWFMSPDDARSKLEDWRRYYKEKRPQRGSVK